MTLGTMQLNGMILLCAILAVGFAIRLLRRDRYLPVDIVLSIAFAAVMVTLAWVSVAHPRGLEKFVEERR